MLDAEQDVFPSVYLFKLLPHNLRFTATTIVDEQL